MDELIDIMRLILVEVQEMNMKLDNIDTSINEIKGFGIYNSIADVCQKLDEVDSTISLSNI